MNETELIERCKNGDAESFSSLILPYEKRLFHFAFRMLQDTHKAEDATQEALLKAYRSIKSYRGAANFSTWLFTILNRVCLDMLRHEKRTGETTHISIHQTGKDEEDYEIAIEDASPGPYEQLRKKEIQKVVEKALAQLSEEHRMMIVLRDLQNMEYDEIAKITNTSLGTVKSRISRARGALRKILETNRELFL